MSSVLEDPGPAPKYDLPSPQAIFEIGFFQEHPEARALRKGVRWHDKKSCSLRGSRSSWAPVLAMHHPTCSGPHFLSLFGGEGVNQTPLPDGFPRGPCPRPSTASRRTCGPGQPLTGAGDGPPDGRSVVKHLFPLPQPRTVMRNVRTKDQRPCPPSRIHFFKEIFVYHKPFLHF